VDTTFCCPTLPISATELIPGAIAERAGCATAGTEGIVVLVVVGVDTFVTVVDVDCFGIE
jgi:hypothetical protein